MRVLCTNGLKTVMLDLVPEFERTSGNESGDHLGLGERLS